MAVLGQGQVLLVDPTWPLLLGHCSGLGRVMETNMAACMLLQTQRFILLSLSFLFSFCLPVFYSSVRVMSEHVALPGRFAKHLPVQRSEAFYECVELYPANRQVQATKAGGLRNCRIFSSRTPADVITFLDAWFWMV